MAMTDPVMRQLYEDHKHFGQVLSVALASFESTSGRSLLQQAMRYMVNYADAFHHPLEDLVFERLLQKDRAVAETVATLEAEHEEIGRMGHALQQRLDTGEEGLVALAREYAARLDAHRSLEERKVFPVAELVLTAKDFDAIRKEMTWLDDPLFGQSLADGYKSLYERVTGVRR